MPYLGKTPSQGVRSRYQFTPNAGTTSLSGADANGDTLTFTDGNYVDVYLNGVILKAGVDYVTTTANTIGSLVATVASDVVDVIVYDTFSLFGGTLEGNVKVNNGTLNVTGAVDFDSTLNVDGAITGTSATLTTADNTTQLKLVSTDADANIGPTIDLYRNSGSPADNDLAGRLQFNSRNDNSQDVTYSEMYITTPDVSDGSEDGQLHIDTMVAGTSRSRLKLMPSETVFNENSIDLDFRVESNGNANMLHVDGGNNGVGIGTTGTSDASLTISTTGQEFQLTLISTDADALQGPRLKLYRNSSSPADGDATGEFTFVGRNDNSQDVDYFQIRTDATDVSDGSEDATVHFFHMRDGTIRSSLTFAPTETIFNDDSRDLDFRVESDGLTHALFVDGGNDKVGIGTASPATPLHVVGNNGILVDTEGNGDGQIYFGGISGSDRTYLARSNNDFLMWNVSDGVMKFGNNNAERMRIDSSGNVMIGTTTEGAAAADNFTVSGSGSVGMTIRSTDSGDTNIYFSDATSGDDELRGYVAYNHANNFMNFGTNASERMRILSGGEVLVGQTSNGVTSTGIGLVSDGVSHMYSGGTHCLMLGRGASNGDVLKFNKSGTTSGSIGVANTDEIYIYSEAGKGILVNNNGLLAGTSSGGGSDDTTDLGQPDVRWDDVYATNGTIQTSDENEKQDIASMTTAELAVGKRLSALFKTFRWKDKVTEKADKARTHSGIVAQQVKAAFEAESLDATKYALFCSNTWWEHNTDRYYTEDEAPEGATQKTRMGIRYPELLSFIASYNESRFTAIEARIAKLEE